MAVDKGGHFHITKKMSELNQSRQPTHSPFFVANSSTGVLYSERANTGKEATAQVGASWTELSDTDSWAHAKARRDASRISEAAIVVRGVVEEK